MKTAQPFLQVDKNRGTWATTHVPCAADGLAVSRQESLERTDIIFDKGNNGDGEVDAMMSSDLVFSFSIANPLLHRGVGQQSGALLLTPSCWCG